jgi:hypothetical protein
MLEPLLPPNLHPAPSLQTPSIFPCFYTPFFYCYTAVRKMMYELNLEPFGILDAKVI